LSDYGELKEFDQKEFIKSDFEKSGLSHKGFIFVPKHFQEKNSKSSKLTQFARKLHVVFHGAGQDYGSVGMAFIEDSGYIEWASTNNIVLLFPQAAKITGPKDSLPKLTPPFACFDFDGYTSKHTSESAAYCTNNGVQPRAFKAMIDRITGMDQ